jgi:branched-chain amino acid transport system substrate-binding protein
VYHNLGIVNGILNVEAIRIAQEKFGKRTLTGDEVRWGFEHLQLDPARVEALGAKGLFHSINVTWDNHEGNGYVTFQQWDGAKWNVVSDWIAPDWALLRPIIEKSSEAYAAEKGIKLRTAEDAGTATN